MSSPFDFSKLPGGLGGFDLNKLPKEVQDAIRTLGPQAATGIIGGLARDFLNPKPEKKTSERPQTRRSSTPKTEVAPEPAAKETSVSKETPVGKVDENGATVYELSFAGFAAENITLELTPDNQIIVNAVRTSPTFAMATEDIQLPKDVTYKQITAHYNAGLVTVVLTQEKRKDNITIPLNVS